MLPPVDCGGLRLALPPGQCCQVRKKFIAKILAKSSQKVAKNFEHIEKVAKKVAKSQNSIFEAQSLSEIGIYWLGVWFFEIEFLILKIFIWFLKVQLK